MDFVLRNIFKKYKRYVEENSVKYNFSEYKDNIEKDAYKNNILVIIFGSSNYFKIYITIFYDEIELEKNYDGYYSADREFNLCIAFSKNAISEITSFKEKGKMGLRNAYSMKYFSKNDMICLKQIYSFTKNSLVKEYIEILKERIK